MLNLSQLTRESPNHPILKRINSVINPDIYLAENVGDYLKNAPNLKCPWYKKFPTGTDRVYIILSNIGIKLAKVNGVLIPNWHVVHDDTGSELVYWNKNHNLFPALESYEQLKEEQGLKNNDWVFDVFMRYLIKQDLPSIVQVRKYNRQDKQPDKISLAETIKSFFPESKALPQPA